MVGIAYNVVAYRQFKYVFYYEAAAVFRRQLFNCVIYQAGIFLRIQKGGQGQKTSVYLIIIIVIFAGYILVVFIIEDAAVSYGFFSPPLPAIKVSLESSGKFEISLTVSFIALLLI